MKKFNFNNISEDFDFGSVSIDNTSDEISQKGVGYSCLQQNQKDIIEKVLMPGVLVDEKTIGIDEDYNMVSVDIRTETRYNNSNTIYNILTKNGYYSIKTLGLKPLMVNFFHETCPVDVIGDYVDAFFSYDWGVIIVLYKNTDTWGGQIYDSAFARIFYTGKTYYNNTSMSTYPKNSPVIKNIQKGLRFWTKLTEIQQCSALMSSVTGIKFEDGIPVLYFREEQIYYSHTLAYNKRKYAPLYKISRSKTGDRGTIVGLRLNSKGEELYRKYINKELSLSRLYREFPNEKLAKEQKHSQILQKVDSGDSITENIISNMKLPIKKIYKELFGGPCPVPTATIVDKYNFGPVYLALRGGVSVTPNLNAMGRSIDPGKQKEPNIGYTIKVEDYLKIWGLPDMDYETQKKLDAYNDSHSIPGCVMTDFDKMPAAVQNVYKTFSDVRDVVITPDDGIVMFVTGKNPIANARKYYNMVKKTRSKIGIKYYVDDANKDKRQYTEYTCGFVLKFTGKVDYNQA